MLTFFIELETYIHIYNAGVSTVTNPSMHEIRFDELSAYTLPSASILRAAGKMVVLKPAG